MIAKYGYAVGAILVLAALTVFGLFMRNEGKLSQRATDQTKFDQINADITRQKADALAIISRAAADQAALAQERDEFKTKLETEHAQNETTTRALQSKYAGLRLKFQGSGCGPSGSGSMSQTGTTTVPTGPAECFVPDSIAAGLRELAADADALKDNYTLCRSYVMGEK